MTAGGCRLPLLHGVAAGFQARRLRAIIIGQVAAHRAASGCGRIISELRDRPAVALVPVRALLLLALAVLGINNEFGRPLPARLIRRAGWRRHGPILAHRSVPLVVSVVGVIVGNAAVPISRVVIGQGREIKPQPEAAPPPSPTPGVVAAIPTAPVPTVVAAAVSTVVAPTVSTVVAATVPTTIAAVADRSAGMTATAVLREYRRRHRQRGSTANSKYE